MLKLDFLVNENNGRKCHVLITFLNSVLTTTQLSITTKDDILTKIYATLIVFKIFSAILYKNMLFFSIWDSSVFF